MYYVKEIDMRVITHFIHFMHYYNLDVFRDLYLLKSA
jgi:hypothetical protein